MNSRMSLVLLIRTTTSPLIQMRNLTRFLSGLFFSLPGSILLHFGNICSFRIFRCWDSARESLKCNHKFCICWLDSQNSPEFALNCMFCIVGLTPSVSSFSSCSFVLYGSVFSDSWFWQYWFEEHASWEFKKYSSSFISLSKLYFPQISRFPF